MNGFKKQFHYNSINIFRKKINIRHVRPLQQKLQKRLSEQTDKLMLIWNTKDLE